MIAIVHPERALTKPQRHRLRSSQRIGSPVVPQPRSRSGSHFSKPESLVKRLKYRKQKAVEEVVDSLTPKLLSVAKRFLRNEEDAADAVQDTFLSALCSIDQFREASSIYTWLYRILVNVCLMKIRARGNQQWCSIDHRDPESDQNCFADLVDARALSPAESIERMELLNMIRSCIDQLSDEFRTIILMRDVEQLDTKQTATILGITEGAVKTRLHRARHTLMKSVELRLN